MQHRPQRFGRHPSFRRIVGGLLLVLTTSLTAYGSDGARRPNVVLILADNVGIGEVGAYGAARGVPTPSLDRLGTEGMRLTNFNVEYSCVVSRIALLTGRYAVRSGNGDEATGMTLWETTIAEGLRSQGYATGLFGKWHVGGSDWLGKREPTNQGFDEWYGIPGTSHVSQFTSFDGFASSGDEVPYIWEGRIGGPAKRVKPYSLDARRTIDREAAALAIRFMQKNVRSGTPFFLYYPMTQLHFPTLPHPDFAGKTGAGDVGDAMADVDFNVGLLLKAIDDLEIADQTLVIWTADNGAEMRRPWRGAAGPWRGFYNSAMEGGIRTPCLIRWPGHIKPGRASDEMVHEIDFFPTIAAAVGAPGLVPEDRKIDGVNQLPFLEGRQSASGRTASIFTAMDGHVMAVKWREWKLWYQFHTEMPDSEPDNLVRMFDLRVDPREEIDVKDFYPWVVSIMDGIVADYEASLLVHPRVPGGAKDPYTPPRAGSGTPELAYSRTDRTPLGPRSDALPHPDITGSWSTAVLSSAPPTVARAARVTPTLGSGWGDQFSIVQSASQLVVERAFFVPRETQPLVRYRYALDGSKTENLVTTGRTGPAPVSTATWDGNRLVITTVYRFQEITGGPWQESRTTQTLWLQPGTSSPFEPSLVVETTRASALGGPTSTNRTVYTKGYRAK